MLAAGAAAAAVPAGDPLAQAEAALARGDGIAAEAAVNRALEAGLPRNEAAALAGEAELLQGELSEARRWLGPGDFAPRTRQRGFHALARLAMAEGDLAAATRAFDRALASGQGSAALWVDIGRMRYRAGQHHLALAAAARAIELDPNEPLALEFTAQLTRDAVGVVAALPWFERAVERAPGDVDLLGEYAATLGEAGRNADMLRVVRRMVELEPRHPRAYYLQAVLAARAGLDDLATRLLARTQGAYDHMPAGQMLAGILELKAGNAALAIDHFDRLVRRQPDNPGAALLLGRALLAHGEGNEVVARFAPAAQRADAPPYLLTLVGRAYEQLGRRREAAGYLDRAAREWHTAIGVLPLTGSDSEVPRLRRLLAERRNGEARALVAQLARRHPGSVDVEIVGGDVALLTGDPGRALATYRRAAQVRRDFALVERMVAAQRLLGRDDAAMAQIAGYLAQNPRSAAASALLGRMLAERGDWPRASALLGHANRLRAGDVRLLADLAATELALGDIPAARATAGRAHALQRANGRVATLLAHIDRAGDGDGQAARALARR